MPAAILKGLRRATKLQFGLREIKMLRPICKTCQRGGNVPPNWYVTCTHEPYVGVRSEVVTKNKYEDGTEPGERILVGTEQQTIQRPWPNFVGVSGATIINSGKGVEKGRLKGFIMPIELRCEAYPEGIADCCEFRECFSQTDLKQYSSGRYCRKMEAAYAYEGERGRTVEINDMERRQQQIDESLARVN